MIAGSEGETIGTYKVRYTFFQNEQPYKEIQRITVVSGENTGVYYECGMVVYDIRTEKKDEPDDFLVAAMFFKNLSSSPLKLVRFKRRSGQGVKKWDE